MAKAAKKSDPKPAKPAHQLVPCADHQRRTCIEVSRAEGVVKFIPLDIVGLSVEEESEEKFDRRYKPMAGYPIERACQLYLGYSRDVGATEEALKYLGQVINITEQEFKMATAKKAAKAEEVKKPAAKKSAPVKKAAPAKKPSAAEKAGKAAKEPGTRGPSAAQMFKDLIMEGKLTDDKIFEKVAAAYGLDEKKRGYVKWYRNDLRKKGMNPPEPKG